MAKGLTGERTRAAIMAAGLDLWRENAGPATIRAIATRAGITHAAILYHYDSAADLQTAIAREAVRQRCPVIVPHLIITKHPAAADLSNADRVRFLKGC